MNSRLGLIGTYSLVNDTNSTGVYSQGDNLSAQLLSRNVTNYEYSGISTSLSSSGVAEGICFDYSGYYLYTITRGATRTAAVIKQYNLSSPFNILTAVYQSGKDLIVGDYELNSNCIDISEDGTKIFFGGYTSDRIWSATLSTPFDLGTAKIDVKVAYLGASVARGVYIGNSGNNMYVYDSNITALKQYSLSVPYDVSTATFVKNANSLSTNVNGFFMSPDGTRSYQVDATAKLIITSHLSTPWDIGFLSSSTDAFISSSNQFTSQTTNPTDFFIGDNGSKLYILGGGADAIDRVYQYNLSTPWTISSGGMTYSGLSTFIPSSIETSPNGLSFNSTGTKMYMCGITSDAIFTYTLGTAWNVSTATLDYIPRFYSVSSQTTTSSGVGLSTDGTKMYVLSGDTATTDTVYQYTLGTTWDVSTATYANKSFSVNAQDATSHDIFFKNDGKTMYVVGSTNDSIFSYTLGTAWDVSTASTDFSSNSYLYTAQVASGTGRGVGLSTDGTKMYVLSGDTATTDTVYQYTLGTTWDVSTATYANKSFSVNAQDATSHDIFFKNDGKTMYMIGATNDTVFSYTLGTAWDVSTASTDFSSNSYLYTAQVASGTGRGVGLSTDGTKMYVLSGDTATTDTVYQYTLGTTWDVSTATYANKSFSVNAQDATSHDIFFSTDGTKMYMIGNTTDRVHQYTLGTAWDVSTATYDNKSIVVGTQDTAPTGFYISPDGLNLYITGQTNDRVSQYSLSTAWDVSTGSFVRNSVNLFEATPTAVYLSPDGLRLYLVGTGLQRIREYTLGTAWDISSLTIVNDSYIGFLDTSPQSLYFKPDGTEMYLVGNTTNRVYQIRNTSWVGAKTPGRFYFTTEETEPRALYISPDGLNLYVTGQTGDDINRYSLSVAWDIGTAFYVINTGSLGEATIGGLYFSPDGLRIYLVGTTLQKVRELTLSVAWDILSGITLVNDYYIGFLDTSPQSLYFKPDGTEMYLVGNTTNRVYQIRNTSWAGSKTPGRTYVGGEETEPRALYISPDGLNLYVTGQTGDDINQYSLLTAWDIGTAFYVRVSAASGEATVGGLYFSDDGLKLYVVGSTQQRIRQFTLSSAWNVSSITFVKNYYVGYFDTVPTGLAFKPDGSEFYIIGDTNDRVHQFSLVENWNITTVKGRFDIIDRETAVSGIYISPDGYRMYIIGQTNDYIIQYDLSTPYDISSATYVRNSTAIPGGTPEGIFFSSDGSKVFVTDTTQDIVREYVMSTSWNVSTMSYTNRFYYLSNLSNTELVTTGIFFKDDGTSFYSVGTDTDRVYQYDLSTPWVVSSVKDRFSMLGGILEGTPTGMHISPDGLNLYVIGQGSDSVQQFSLSTAWDLDTATYVRTSAAIGEGTPFDVHFSPDGTKMYVLGTTTGNIRQFNLSTAWNVSTISFSKSINANINGDAIETVGMHITDDGNFCYITNSFKDVVYQVELTNSFEMDSFKNLYFIGTQESSIRDFEFSPDGRKLIICGSGNDKIVIYPLSTPYALHTASYISLNEFSFSEPFGIDVSRDGKTIFIVTGNAGTTAPIGYGSLRQINMGFPHLLTVGTLSPSKIFGLNGITGNTTFGWDIFVTPDRKKMFILSPTVQGLYEFKLKF